MSHSILNNQQGEILTEPKATELLPRSMTDLSQSKTIVVIEPRSLVRWCLCQWFEQNFDMSRLVAVSSPEDLASQLNGTKQAALIVWSIGGMSVSRLDMIQDLDRIKSQFPDIPVVLLADREDVADIAKAISCGVRGYVPTSLDRQEIPGILRFISSGGTFVPVSIVLDPAKSEQRNQSHSDCSKPLRSLTPREIDVVDRLRRAMSNKAIAHELQICESTVKVLVHRILTKLNAANRTEVACLAQQHLEGGLLNQ